jgi:hypothetical protein
VELPAVEHEHANEFLSELKQCKAPSVEVEAIPTRLILD